MKILEFLVGLVTGIISGFGIGGGSLLILYLTAVGRGKPVYRRRGEFAVFYRLRPLAPSSLISRTSASSGRRCCSAPWRA